MNKNPIYATFLSSLVEGLLVDLMQDPTVVFDVPPFTFNYWDVTINGPQYLNDGDLSTYYKSHDNNSNYPSLGDRLQVEFQEAKKINSIYLLPWTRYDGAGNTDEECS